MGILKLDRVVDISIFDCAHAAWLMEKKLHLVLVDGEEIFRIRIRRVGGIVRCDMMLLRDGWMDGWINGVVITSFPASLGVTGRRP